MIISPNILYTGIAALLLAGGAGWYGYTKGKAISDVKIAEFNEDKEKMKADYEQQLSEKKTEVVIQYVDKWHVIEKKEKEYVNIAKNDVPNQHELSNGFVRLHDASARNAEIDRAAASDGTSSGVADNQALAVVVSNYSKYHQCAAQLVALQSIIQAHNKTIDELNRQTKKK